MLRTVVRPSDTIRRTVILAAAVALIVPLPARCATCSASATSCSQCQDAHLTAAAPTYRSCCERHTIASRHPAPAVNCPTQVQSKTCGCNMQAPDRTYVAADRPIIAPELVATLPGMQSLPTFDAGQITRITAANENVPPPVPHRILHCSWII